MAQNPSLLRACGTIGLFAAITPIFTDIFSWFLVEDYSPIAHSISQLAVGPSSWLIDLGLWSFVLACLALAVGLWNWLPALRLASGTAAALVLVGVCVGIVARVNQYAGTENPNANIHFWAVCALAAMFALTAFLAVPALGRRSAGLARFSLGTGILWIVLCPIYWFWTDAWSGAVERLLALLMIVWLVVIAHSLRAAAGEAGRGRARA